MEPELDHLYLLQPTTFSHFCDRLVLHMIVHADSLAVMSQVDFKKKSITQKWEKAVCRVMRSNSGSIMDPT